MFCHLNRSRTLVNVEAKDENIGFDGYIGTMILRIYRRYIGIYKIFKI